MPCGRRADGAHPGTLSGADRPDPGRDPGLGPQHHARLHRPDGDPYTDTKAKADSITGPGSPDADP